jgi:hypothetical protein
MPTVEPNSVMLTGENPFIRLSATDGGSNTTDASFWRITFSPGGPGHVLYLKSELTEGQRGWVRLAGLHLRSDVAMRGGAILWRTSSHWKMSRSW